MRVRRINNMQAVLFNNVNIIPFNSYIQRDI